jgi:hypothetical protein
MTGDASLIPRIEVIQRRAALCKQGYSEALRGVGQLCFESGFLEQGLKYMRQRAEDLPEAN